MDLTLKWQEVLNNPFFNDVPFKVELNKFGQILMSPASNKHGIVQNKTARNIEKEKRNGVVIIECSILTSEGVKVADVAWASDKFISEFSDQTPYPKAPEICVEIVSSVDSQAEMTEKKRLYLEKGALEVWIVSLENEVKIFTHTGQIELSELVKGFKL